MDPNADVVEKDIENRLPSRESGSKVLVGGQKAYDEIEFPEGGLKAWLVVFGAFITQFCTFGYTNSYGVYNDFYVREFMEGKYTSSQLSWVGSTQLLLVLSVGLVTGRAFDTGYFYHLMFGGSFLFVFSIFMLSLVHPGQYYQVFLTQGVGTGMGVGMVYLPSMAVVSQYFHRRRSFAMGIVASGSGLGGALQPIMLNKLIHGKTGFHRAVLASAGFNLGLLCIALSLMRTRLPPHPGHKQGSLGADFKRFFKEPTYLLTVVGTVLMLMGAYFPIFFLQLNALTNGIDGNMGFYLLPVLNGASVIGRLLPPFLAQRVGVYNMIIPCTAMCAVLIFINLSLQNLAGFMTYAALYGLFIGGYIGLLAPMLGSLAMSQSEIGARMGICFAFTGFGGLAGSPIAGALLSSRFIWWRPILFAGLCVSCGTLLFTTTRFMLTKSRGRWKV